MDLIQENSQSISEINFHVLEAMERLLGESKLSELSISQICIEAHISRSTFYKHFSDKYDVGKWHYELLCSQHLDNLGAMGYRNANLAMLESFAKYRSYYRYAFAEEGPQSLTAYAYGRREHTLKEIIQIEKGLPVSCIFAYQLAAFNAAAVHGVIEWIKQDMPLPCTRVAELLETIIPDVIRDALEGVSRQYATTNESVLRSIGEADSSATQGAKTRAHIVNCMNDLLETQDIEGLTVKAICDTARMSRTTFYNHFYDKFEVYQWHLDRMYKSILSQAGRTCTFREANHNMLAEVMRLRHLFRAVTFHTGRESLAMYAKNRRERDLTETLVYHRGKDLSDKLVFQINALVTMEVIYVLRWIREDMPASVEEMVDGLDEIVPQDLFRILNSLPERH